MSDGRRRTIPNKEVGFSERFLSHLRMKVDDDWELPDDRSTLSWALHNAVRDGGLEELAEEHLYFADLSVGLRCTQLDSIFAIGINHLILKLRGFDSHGYQFAISRWGAIDLLKDLKKQQPYDEKSMDLLTTRVVSYLKPLHAVAAIVNHEGNILMGKKNEGAQGFLSGEWHVPGETMKYGEDKETALHRGIKEEANIEIKVLDYLATHHTPTPTPVHWYTCVPKTYDIQAGSDLSEVRWVPKGEVPSFCSEKARALWPKKIRAYFDVKEVAK